MTWYGGITYLLRVVGSITISKPVLYIFSVSHFCEKGCWALDHHGIEYDIRYLTPGFHVLTAKKLGVPGTTVPILVTDGQVVQGSAEIIDWAEAGVSGASQTLTPEEGLNDCIEIEKRLDEIAGVHVRRYYYSSALFDEPEAVKKMYANDVSFFRGLLVNGTWGVVRKEMIKVMDLGPEQGLESKSIVEGELDWLDGLLSGGRAYLLGDRFSRADLTVASLLAPLVIPNEHPVYPNLNLPERFISDLEAWKDRPSVKWVRDIYTQHRSI